MAKILILIGAHLCTAPRPQKEADALAAAGHEVTVQGFWFDPELVERDRLLIPQKKWQFKPILDFQPNHRINNWKIRFESRLAKVIYQKWGKFSPGLLGYGATAMLKVARQARADLTIVHSETGLWAGKQLLNAGYRVGVDFEDWFSEDLLPVARTTRPVKQLKILEQFLTQNCTYCLTTSHALAEALANTYHAPKPTVIYNSFPWAERELIDGKNKDRHNLSLPSLHWFSQKVGPGRGLETLFQALAYLKKPLEIHLRGICPESTRTWIENQVSSEWRDHIFIHPTVPNHELLSRIAEHDIGLALEQTEVLSRNLTVTNKLFQYLQAGLAVIATDTQGQQEIFSQFSTIGRMIPCEDPVALADALTELLTHPEKLASAKAAALAAAKQFSWENQAENLLKSADQALKSDLKTKP
ncbi:MAG: glycosyltransferase family protein [Microcoleaceae cyanobacterium]